MLEIDLVRLGGRERERERGMGVRDRERNTR